MPKNDDTVLNKKMKEKLTNEIIDEINDTIKEDIINDVVKDVKDEINYSFKNEIKDTVKEELIVDIKNDIRKEEKRLYRRKNFQIFRLYIYIILLITCSVLMIYKLYKTGNLEIGNKEFKEKISSVMNVETTTTTTELIKDLEYYKNNYGYLVNDLKFNNLAILKGNNDVSNIELNDRLAISYNKLNREDINIDGVIYTVSEDQLLNAYKSIFGSEEGYEPVNFKVGNISFAYSASSKNYIALINEDTLIDYTVNNIIDVIETDNSMVFTCTVAYVKGNHVYSINNTYYKVSELSDGNVDFSSINNRLTKVKYVFENVDGSYKLVRVERI